MVLLITIQSSTAKNPKRKKTFETNIIRLISILLVILFLSLIVLYYSVMQSMYSEQLEKSNNNVIEQVGISFEMIMQQITDGIYKIPLYDTEMLRMIRSKDVDMLYQIDLQRKLDSIILGNKYLYSSYLYIPTYNIVYSSEYGNSYPLDAFPDLEAIVLENEGTITILDPRRVTTNQGSKLLLSVVCPIPVYQGNYEGLLVVNIDANKLYYDILNRIKAEENMNIHVYNNEDEIIINKDESLLFTKIDKTESENTAENKLFNLDNGILHKKVIHSSYYSKQLKWTFVLETSIKSAPTFLTNLYTIGIVLLALLILSLSVMILIVKITAKPMIKALSGYNDKLWVDFLTDNSVQTPDLYSHLESDIAHFKYSTYGVIVMQLVKADNALNCFLHDLSVIKSTVASISPACDAIVVPVHKNLISIVVNFEGHTDVYHNEQKIHGFAKAFYERLSQEIKPFVYASASLPKKNAQTLPIAYRECIDAQNFRITSGDSHVILSSTTRRSNSGMVFDYPLELERQLMNNILVGNPKACGIFIQKFYDELLNNSQPMSDNEIKNCIYQLQNSILRSVSNLPVSIKVDNAMNILNLFDMQEIKDKVTSFVTKLAQDIKSSSENKDSNLVHSIFEFIDKNFMDTDFNLNGAADELGLNRNYLSKLVKEKTGESFNEYVSKKRIALAKTLLQDKETPVEDIAHKTGFNYSHYFIKVFKNYEGITPGQYRDKLIR